MTKKVLYKHINSWIPAYWVPAYDLQGFGQAKALRDDGEFGINIWGGCIGSICASNGLIMVKKWLKKD